MDRCYVALRLSCNRKTYSISVFSHVDAAIAERDPRANAQVFISQHTIDNSGAHTGITNSVRKSDTASEQRHATVESTPSTRSARPASIKAERDDSTQRPKPAAAFAESQFYARSSGTPQTKHPESSVKKSSDFYVTPATNETAEDLARYKPPVVIEKGRKTNAIVDWIRLFFVVMPMQWNRQEKTAPNEELFISEPVEGE